MTGEATSGGALLHTALHARHLAAGARMVDFGGWDMPIQYRGILAEHGAVRSSVGVFDLSHMGRLHVRGARARDLVQWLTTNDVDRLGTRAGPVLAGLWRGRPILDDIIVYNLGDELLLVVNASNRVKILEWIGQHRGSDLAGLDADNPRRDARDRDDRVSGSGVGAPAPGACRRRHSTTLRYYAAVKATVAGTPALIARTGYTGEDGFEVIVSAADGPDVWDRCCRSAAASSRSACWPGRARHPAPRSRDGPLRPRDRRDDQPVRGRPGPGRQAREGRLLGREALWRQSTSRASSAEAGRLRVDGRRRAAPGLPDPGRRRGGRTGDQRQRLAEPGQADRHGVRSESHKSGIGTEIAVEIRGGTCRPGSWRSHSTSTELEGVAAPQRRAASAEASAWNLTDRRYTAEHEWIKARR